MADLFKNKSTFNQDISTWDTSAVTHMGGMFNGATAFNKDISTWNTAAVTDMRWMFLGASSFDNGGVALDWSDTSKVTNMSLMFRDATAFNQNIDNWNVSSVIDMNAMFWSATAFNQNIGNWNVSSVTTMNDMFKNVTLSTANYDLLLQGFNELELQDNINFDGGNSKYSAGEIAMYRANIISTDSWTITDGGIGDSTSPILSSASPADGATGVAVDANIVLTFSEAVDVESGNITIKKSSDDSTVETIDVTSGLVSGTGTTTITINPATTLTSSTGYYLNIAAAAFDDNAGNSYAGITDATTLNFTIADVNNPTLSSSTPANGATGVAVDANIVLTFSEAVDVASGNITIKKSSDDSTVETIAVTDSKITGTGTTQITINPSSTLASSTGYYLNIATTAFDDGSSNSYAGITDATTLNFTVIGGDPTLKKDVIGSIEAWSDISSRWFNSSIDSVFNRINWLSKRQGSSQTSHQGIKLSFVDTLIDKIMNNSSTTALIDINVVETSASIIKNSDGSASEVSSNALSEASDIVINEAVIIREGLIDSLNPSFSPVLGSWSIWTEGKIIIGKTDASSSTSKKKNGTQTITLGFDKPILSGDELMGFALSVGKDDVDIGTGLTNVKSNNFSLSTYNVIRPSSNTQLESVFGLGRLDFDTVRTDGSDTLTGARKANQLFFSSSLRPQNTINLGNWQFSPYSKVSFAKTNLKAFSESGASTALTYDKQKLDDTSMGIGLDISSQITTDTSKIKPYAKIELNQSSSKTSASMNYNNENAYTHSYTTNLNRKHKNWKMKLGLDLDTESGWDTSFTYTREQSIGSSANSKNSNSFSFNAGMSF